VAHDYRLSYKQLSIQHHMQKIEKLINKYDSKLFDENNLKKLKPWQALIVKIK